MSTSEKDSGVGCDSLLGTASDLESLPSSQPSSVNCSPRPGLPAAVANLPGPSASRSRYSSPLSSFRNNYKPPERNVNFKPICFSSPISKPQCNTTTEDPVAIMLTPERPSPAPTSLTGRGGDWRGAVTGDMQPQNRRFTPRGGQRGSPFRGGNRNSSFGGCDERFGNNSYSSNSSWGNSFNCSTPQSTLYSPYPSSEGSFNSRRGNRTHNTSRTPDIGQFIHPSMTEDPWCQLVSERRRNGET